jgi:cupin 2 domain-containing protein
MFGTSVGMSLRIILVAMGTMGELGGMKVFRNLLTIPNENGTGETIEPILTHPAFTLEHILSRGAASPEGFWYDQPRDEWVILLKGEAELRFESGESSLLHSGDSLVIPAHRRHRVERTSHDAIWLALHFQNADWDAPP